jgi:hypothetical protein
MSTLSFSFSSKQNTRLASSSKHTLSTWLSFRRGSRWNVWNLDTVLVGGGQLLIGFGGGERSQRSQRIVADLKLELESDQKQPWACHTYHGQQRGHLFVLASACSSATPAAQHHKQDDHHEKPNGNANQECEGLVVRRSRASNAHQRSEPDRHHVARVTDTRQVVG